MTDRLPGARPARQYRNQRCWSDLLGAWCDSKTEREWLEGLKLREKAGQITELVLHPKWVLSERPRVTVSLDAGYQEDGQYRADDVKGGPVKESMRIKYAWLRQQYGVVVRIVRRGPGGDWEVTG